MPLKDTFRYDVFRSVLQHWDLTTSLRLDKRVKSYQKNFGASIECTPTRAKIKINMQKTSFNRFFLTFSPILSIISPFYTGCGKKNANFANFWGHFSKKIFSQVFKKNDIYGGNFMREIDSAHSQSMKTLPWPWFREWGGCIEAKINLFTKIRIPYLNQGQGSVFMPRECAQ